MVSSAIDDAVKAYGIILSQGDISISRKGDIIISLLQPNTPSHYCMLSAPIRKDCGSKIRNFACFLYYLLVVACFIRLRCSFGGTPSCFLSYLAIVATLAIHNLLPLRAITRLKLLRAGNGAMVMCGGVGVDWKIIQLRITH